MDNDDTPDMDRIREVAEADSEELTPLSELDDPPTERYRVECEQCGLVEFDVLDTDWFGNATAATWYAGYHAGKEHPSSDYQEAFPVKVGHGGSPGGAEDILEEAEKDDRSVEEVLADQHQINETTDWDLEHMLAEVEDDDLNENREQRDRGETVHRECVREIIDEDREILDSLDSDNE